MAKEKKFREVGSFTEEFHNFDKVKVLEGVFNGIIKKNIDKEEREFASVTVEGKPKVQIAGGRDLVNKCSSLKAGDYVRITFTGKEKFTPKGTKKKVDINRYKVEVGE